MRVYEKDGKLEGLRLIDEDGKYVFDETWYTFGETEPWSEVKTIPAGHQLIGYKCENVGYEINGIVFQVW